MKLNKFFQDNEEPCKDLEKLSKTFDWSGDEMREEDKQKLLEHFESCEFCKEVEKKRDQKIEEEGFKKFKKYISTQFSKETEEDILKRSQDILHIFNKKLLNSNLGRNAYKPFMKFHIDELPAAAGSNERLRKIPNDILEKYDLPSNTKIHFDYDKNSKKYLIYIKSNSIFDLELVLCKDEEILFKCIISTDKIKDIPLEKTKEVNIIKFYKISDE